MANQLRCFPTVLYPPSLLPAEATVEQTQHCVRLNSPCELFIAPPSLIGRKGVLTFRPVNGLLLEECCVQMT